MSVILAVARIELVRLFRARTALTLLLIVPALQLALFGYAIQPVASRATVALASPDALATAAVLPALQHIPGLAAPTAALAPGGAEAEVRAGDALVGVEVPVLRGPAHPTAPERPIKVIIDGSDPAAAAIATQAVRAAYWRGVAAGRPGPGLVIKQLYNPGGRADWNFLPALSGVVMMISMIMLGTLSIAREREQGTWEALLALPVSPTAALAGKLLPYVLLGSIQGLTVLVLGLALFDLPMRGSILALFALMPLFAAAHLAMGAAIAIRAQAQLDALQSAIAFYLPSMLLSGFLYPFDTLPRWARIAGEIFPLTHFIRAAREATLYGGDASAVLTHAAPIAAFLLAAAMVTLAAGRTGLD